MKKRMITFNLALAMILGVAYLSLSNWDLSGKAQDTHHRGWQGVMFKNYTISAAPSSAVTQKSKLELEAIIDSKDPTYSRDVAVEAQGVMRNMIKTWVRPGTQLDGTNGCKSLERLISTGGYRRPILSTPQPSSAVTPTPQPTQPTQPTPTTTPAPTPAPTIPNPVNPIQYNTPTDYYFASSGDQWQEVWYNSSSLMYLRGSVPADCDTSRFDCWQLSFDLDGETVTVQGNGCVSAQGTSLDVGFPFDDDLINKVESYFIKGGDNVPVTFRYYAGGSLKKASVSGQPKLMLAYDGWLRLYVGK